MLSGRSYPSSRANPTDKHLKGTRKIGIFVRDFYKFLVETVTNVAPSLLDENQENDDADCKE